MWAREEIFWICYSDTFFVNAYWAKGAAHQSATKAANLTKVLFIKIGSRPEHLAFDFSKVYTSTSKFSLRNRLLSSLHVRG